MERLIVIIAAMLAIMVRLDADVLARYDFSGSVKTSSDTDLGSTAPALTDGAGWTSTINASAGNSAPSSSVDVGLTLNSEADAVSANDYYTFTITPEAGFELDLTSLTFDRAVVGNVTGTFFVRSSADNFTLTLGTTSTNSSTFANTSISLTDAAFQDLSSPITFRLYIFDSNNGSNRFDLVDNIILNGTANPIVVPEPSTWTTLTAGIGLLIGLQFFRRKTKFGNWTFWLRTYIYSFKTSPAGIEPAFKV